VVVSGWRLCQPPRGPPARRLLTHLTRHGVPIPIPDLFAGLPIGATLLAGEVTSSDVTILLQVTLDAVSVAIRPA
jgi:hypothetical protein